LGALVRDGVYTQESVWVIFPINTAVGRTRTLLKSGALHSESFVAIALNVFNERTRATSRVIDELKTVC
jgi:hypothetical protein